MSGNFNPHSSDAMFATVLAKLEEQSEVLAAIHAEARKTNGRIGALERWRDIVTAKTAVIAALASFAVAVLCKYFLG